MKNIVGKEAKIYNYINNVFKIVSDYYKYEYVEMPIVVENEYGKNEDLKLAEIKDTNLIVRPSIEASVRNYYKKNINEEKKKYCYSGNVYVSKKEEKRFGFLVTDSDSIYQDAEMISMVYRILEEIRLENIIVKIKASDKYDLEKLQEYLEYLDVDYEIHDSGELLDDLIPMAFEIVEEVKNKKIVLVRGSKSNNEFKAISCNCYLDNILDILNVIYEDRTFDVLTQVVIVSETEEEKIAGMRLAQDLRWCEIIVEFDITNKTRKEQLNGIKDTNFIIDISKEDLNKGLIKVIDYRTKEETLVDESEIIDYIVSNI